MSKIISSNIEKLKNPSVWVDDKDIEVSWQKGIFSRNTLKGSMDLVRWELVTEANKQKIGSSLGWGAVGAVLMGPLGAVAGAAIGGRKSKKLIACEFSDDRKFIIEVGPNDYARFKTRFANQEKTEMEKDSLSQSEHGDKLREAVDAADALLKLKQLLDAGIISEKEYEDKRVKLLYLI